MPHARQEEPEEDPDLPVIDPAQARLIDLPLHEATTPGAPAAAPAAGSGLLFDPLPEPDAYPLRSSQSLTGAGQPVAPFSRPFEDLDLHRPTEAPPMAAIAPPPRPRWSRSRAR